MISIAAAGPSTRRTYDHRLREHVVRAGARALGYGFAIPRSTVSTWQRRGLRPVATIGFLEQNREQLLEAIAKLDRRDRILAAVVRLLVALLRVSKFDPGGRRLPEGSAKADIPPAWRRSGVPHEGQNVFARSRAVDSPPRGLAPRRRPGPGLSCIAASKRRDLLDVATAVYLLRDRWPPTGHVHAGRLAIRIRAASVQLD
jgi:hypothetical protein